MLVSEKYLLGVFAHSFDEPDGGPVDGHGFGSVIPRNQSH